jgi:zinc transport system ATP-binding protein
LWAERLCVGHRGRPALSPVSWSIRRGEIWALLGRNGSGKTTLLRTLMQLMPKLSGNLTWAPGLAVSYVAQTGSWDAAVPMPVADYVRGGAIRGHRFLWPHNAAEPHLQALRAEFRLQKLWHRPVQQLSEGEKQRVALARALAGAPDLLVLDEPTSAMDAATEAQVLAQLPQLAVQHRLAIAVVGHHLPALLAHASHWAWVDGPQAPFIAGPRAQVAQSPGFAQQYPGLVALGQGGVAGGTDPAAGVL